MIRRRFLCELSADEKRRLLEALRQLAGAMGPASRISLPATALDPRDEGLLLAAAEAALRTGLARAWCLADRRVAWLAVRLEHYPRFQGRAAIHVARELVPVLDELVAELDPAMAIKD